MNNTEGLRPRCLCLDIETSVGPDLHINKIGGWRADSGESVHFQGRFAEAEARERLDWLAAGAAFVLGHNIAGHDLPLLEKLYLGLGLLGLPVIDTLWLSPLAFPQNPYHSLIKDYKLVKDSRNDPLQDARLSFRLFCGEIDSFRHRLAVMVKHGERLLQFVSWCLIHRLKLLTSRS